MRKTLLIMLGLLLSLPALARDFTYEYEGQTLTYTVVDEDEKTCMTKSGHWDDKTYISIPGNAVSGDLKIPDIAFCDGAAYTVATLGERSFANCSELTSVEIPNTVVNIEDQVFEYCVSLESIIIPDSVEMLGSYLFHDCRGLTTAIIGNSVKELPYYMFGACYALRTITIGESVSDINQDWLANVSSIESINVSERNQTYTSINGVLYDKDVTTVICYPKLKVDSIELPTTVTSIAPKAFYGCNDLKSAIIPGTISVIGEEAFRSCDNLTYVRIPSSITSIEAGAFVNSLSIKTIKCDSHIPCEIEESTFSSWVYGNATLSVPKGCEETYRNSSWGKFVNIAYVMEPGREFVYEYEGQTLTYAVVDEDEKTCMTKRGTFDGSTYIPGCEVSGDLKIPAVAICDGVEYTVETIGGGSFWNCPGLTSVEIPNSVKTIESSAFVFDTSLSDVKIPDSVIIIGSTVFYGCTALQSIVIPDSVTEIDFGTFYGCTSLTSVTLGNSLKETGYSLFAGCTSLESIVIPDSVETLGDGLFGSCTSLKTVVIGNSVKEIPQYLCDDCTNLTLVKFGNSITRIDTFAFSECSSLTSIDIPDSVERIDEAAFQNCTSLSSVYIGKSVTRINYLQFNKCSAIQSLRVSENNENYSSIDDILYDKNATKLIWCPSSKTSVNIPNSVTTIGNNAFIDCKNLITLDIPSSVEIIEWYAFHNCKGLISIHLPQSLTSIEEHAFAGCSSLETIDIPGGVTSIGDRAFEYCYGLTSVKIGKSLEAMGRLPFSECEKLKSLEVSEENNTYASKDGVLYNKDFTELIWCPDAYEATYINIPETVTTLCDMALADCDNLQAIVIPNSVSSIGMWMFSNKVKSIILPQALTSLGYMSLTSNLKEVYYTASEPIEGDNDMVSDMMYESTVLYVPAGTLSKFQSTFPWSNFTNIVEIDFGNIPGFTAKVEDTYLSLAAPFESESRAKVALSYGVPGAKIYYSLTPEGTEPTGEYTLYTEPVSVSKSSTLSVYVEYYGNKTGVNTYTINVENAGHDAGYEFTYEYEGKTLSYLVLDPKAKTCYTKPGTVVNNAYVPGNNVSGDLKIPAVAICDGVEYTVMAIGAGSFITCQQLNTVEMPNTITIIDNSAFALSSVTNVVLSNTLTRIYDTVFYGCTSLTSIDIPNSVKQMGATPFYQCISMTSAIIGNSIQTIGEGAFYGCSKLANITLGSSIKTIEEGAFQGCGLLSVDIPDSVETIQYYAFGECENLTDITIGSSCVAINSEAFVGDKSLRSFTVSEKNKAYCSKDGVVYNKDMTELIVCPKAAEAVEIPNTVTAIQASAFYGCEKLKSIDIPNSVTNIGWRAFRECKSLTSVSIPASVTNIEGYAFEKCSNLVSMNIPNTIKAIEMGTFRSCAALASIDIPESVESIGTFAFDGCKSLKSIVIPKTVTTIESLAFAYSGIEEVYYNVDTPIAAPVDVFSDDIYSSATLYIPQGALQTFKSTTPWNKFENIVETGLVANVVATADDDTVLDKKIDYVSEGAFELSLTCSQEDAKIYYRLTPVSAIDILAEDEYLPYTGSIEVTRTSILSVYAENDGKKSPVKDYKILVYVTPEEPIAKVGETTLSSDDAFESNEAVEVALTCATEGAKIHYLLTADEAVEPAAEAEYVLYTEPVKVETSSTLRVYAELDGRYSAVVAYKIEIEYLAPAEPVAKVGETVLSTESAFESTEAVEVALSCETEGAEIYYLLTPANAAEPTAEAEYTQYTEPVKVETTAKLSVYALNSRGLKSEVKTYDIDIKTNTVSMTMADLDGAEVYTLEGLRVVYPTAGRVYIIRKDGRTFKAFVK